MPHKCKVLPIERETCEIKILTTQTLSVTII